MRSEVVVYQDLAKGAKCHSCEFTPSEVIRMSDSTKLRRSSDRMIAGVCGGIARHLDVPATRVRVIYVLLSVVSAGFPGILVYLILWALLPEA